MAEHLGKRMPGRKEKRQKIDDEMQETMNGMQVNWDSEEHEQVFKKKYAVEKGKKIKEKQYKKLDGYPRESIVLQKQQKQVFLPAARKNDRSPGSAELKNPQKNQRREQLQKKQKIKKNDML